MILLVPSDTVGHKPPGEVSFRLRMFMRLTLALVVFSCLTASAALASDKAVLGSWEGDSKCTVPTSPCHDEHVLFQVSEDKKDPFQLNLDAYKIIDGSPEFMGTLSCHYESKAGALSCTTSNREKDDWEFHVIGDTMAGRLLVDDGKTLYRRITLHRSPK